MKGLVLAGGLATRLYPVTKAISKHLIPIHDKPMIYYPLSTLMMIGIRQIAFIVTPFHCEQYKRLLGDGQQLGCHFHYIIQEKPQGIAQALILAENFIADERIALILGDNLFYGLDLNQDFQKMIHRPGACILAYQVDDPERFGIVHLNEQLQVVAIEEKPTHPTSNYAITGLYFYDSDAIHLAKKLKLSERGEFEITDLNRLYLQHGRLHVHTLQKSVIWFDLGTFDTLASASTFVRTTEAQRTHKIGCIEEIALQMNYINKIQFDLFANSFSNNTYGIYLRLISNEGERQE